MNRGSTAPRTAELFRFLRSGIALAVLWPLLHPAAAADSVRALELEREASMAEAEQDFPTFLTRSEEAASLRPDSPRLLMRLAAAHLANNDADAALATLERIVAMGVSMPVARDDSFQALHGTEEFEAVVRELAANTRPSGRGETAFALREVTGLIEGIAWDENGGEFLFGDINGRAVWARNQDGTLRRFSAESDELLGVFGLAVDAGRRVLWAAMSAVPAMRGFSADQEGVAALAEIELGSGEVRRTIYAPELTGIPGLPLLGDVVVAPDGTVYATGSATGVVWRLPAGAPALEYFAESEESISLEGITVVEEGSALLVADRMNGLFRIDIAGGGMRRLEVPADTTLIGVDGLVTAPDGTVLAVQNGTSPNRILRLRLEPGAQAISQLSVIEAGHFTMAAPAHGCIGPAGDFYFVGNSGWHRFSRGDEPTEPRSLPIFRTRLGNASRR
jgi:sugar lactone lactonase YvrE